MTVYIKIDKLKIGILSPVLVTIDGVWIDHLQGVTANNYNSITDFHTKSSQSTFTSLYLVTALSNGYSSTMFSLDVSW
jgi:hypothetical protein